MKQGISNGICNVSENIPSFKTTGPASKTAVKMTPPDKPLKTVSEPLIRNRRRFGRPKRLGCSLDNESKVRPNSRMFGETGRFSEPPAEMYA